MTLEQRDAEVAYLATVKQANPWFDHKQTVRLTYEQVDLLLRHAYRAGLKRGDASLSLFEKLMGGAK